MATFISLIASYVNLVTWAGSEPLGTANPRLGGGVTKHENVVMKVGGRDGLETKSPNGKTKPI